MELSQDQLDQFNRNDLYTTIDLHIQYLAPAKESPYTCLAETTHQTRTWPSSGLKFGTPTTARSPLDKAPFE